MINLAISLGLVVLVAVGMSFLDVSLLLGIPFGLVIGVAAFLFLSRRVQGKLEVIMGQMQKDIQANKLDRAIETLKKGYAFQNQQLFIKGQINSQIGMLYYLKKDNETAFTYLQKGFIRHFIGQGMLAVIHYKRKDFDAMNKVMEATLKANSKESICYGLYAYLLCQTKNTEKAIQVLQQGLKKLPKDQRLSSNLTLLQNNKRMKMKVYGDMWIQFLLERPPRIQQELPPHLRMKRKAMFR